MSESVTIKGELFWTRDMNNFNTKFNPDNKKYQCTVGNISPEDSKKLETLGIKLKSKDTQGSYIVAKSNFVFTPFDEKGSPVDIAALGNGSLVTVVVSSYPHRMSDLYGKAPSVQKIIVNKVITYTPPEGDALDDVL